MTTIVVEDVVTPSPHHRVRWWAMVHVSWLSHRVVLIGLMVLAVGCALAMFFGEQSTHSAYTSYVANGCVARPFHVPCGTIANSLANDTDTFSAIVIALHVLPVIVGLFIGAPLIAREIESGTYRFTWTQEIGRTRFVLTTLVMLGTVVTVVACFLGLLLGWYAHPFEVVGLETQWHSGLFDTAVAVLGAWTLFAFALGTCIGALIGRTVAAMAATAAVVGGLLIVSFLYLVHYLLGVGTIVTSTIVPNAIGSGALNQNSTSGPSVGSWLVRGWITGPNGKVLSTRAAYAAITRAYDATQNKVSDNPVPTWLSQHHFTYWVSYQPASRFWIFQLAVVVVLVALAVLSAFATIQVLQRRAAH